MAILGLWAAAIVVAEATTWLLLRSQGVNISGDSPSYLIEARTLANFHVNPVPVYLRDFASHYFYQWPPNATLSPAIVHVITGPHGPVYTQNLGLPGLLAPFIFIGSAPLALLGFFMLNAVGVVYAHQRFALLAALNRGQGLVFALILAAPAVWLAATQVYPDLLTGIVLACVLAEVAWMERQGRLGVAPAIVVGAGLALIPWLEVKNLVPAGVVLVALGLICYQGRISWAKVGGVASAFVVSLVALGVYNQYYFGDLLGLHEPPERVNIRTITQMAALVFDRHQGFAVQVPVVLIGVLGICYAVRRLPLSVLASLLAAGSVLVINGAQYSPIAMGSEALAGRFAWTALPVLLVWSVFYLRRIRAPRLFGLFAAIGALWIWQGVPILTGSHTYINATVVPFAPWDPSTYPGWWPGLNSALPAMLATSTHSADYLSRLVFEVALLAAGAALLHRLTGAPPPPARVAIATLATAVVLGALVAVAPGSPLPPPLSWSGADLGSPYLAATQPIEEGPLPLVTAGPGTYRITINYEASGPTPTTVSLLASPSSRIVVSGWFTPRHPTDGATFSVSSAPVPTDAPVLIAKELAPVGGGVGETLRFRITGTALVSYRVTVPVGDSVTVSSMQLQKRSD